MSHSSGDPAAPLPESGEADEDAPFASVRRSATTQPEGTGTAGVDGEHTTLPPSKFVARGVLGHGGSSVVIRAFDPNILRDVAVKVLKPEFADGDAEAARFVEEARISGQLEHPNVVPVYEFGVQETGRRYLCMKVVEGENLEDVLDRLGDARLEPEALADFLQIFVKVCEAVAFAHSRGVIHRDLKPRNIMISDFGQVYVVDWGIAKLRERQGAGPRIQLGADDPERQTKDPPNSFIGTFCYMAPEQIHCREDDLDERTDVFALGGTLFQILTGHPPLTPEIVRSILSGRPQPVEQPDRLVAGGRVPPELARIALRALAYDPAARYASVAELKHDIESFQRGAWRLPRVSLPAGAVIIEEGATGDAAYVVQSGECAAYRSGGTAEVVLRVMGPGEVFGETAVFSEKPRTASVKALTDVVLLVVTRDVLAQAVGLNSWMGAFVKALAERFREADERLRTMDPRRGER